MCNTSWALFSSALVAHPIIFTLNLIFFTFIDRILNDLIVTNYNTCLKIEIK